MATLLHGASSTQSLYEIQYFSEDYTPCVTRASGWCNIPNKARFNPTEQTMVAYHKGTVVYAYKCLFTKISQFFFQQWMYNLNCVPSARLL